MNFQNTEAFARQLDREDAIAFMRERFIIPAQNGQEKVYFLGNSLGLQPKATRNYLDTILQDWANLGVEGFFHAPQPWMDYHEALTGPLSTIVGCRPEEISVMNQLTVNLHLLLVSFYRPEGKRRKILCESKAFPSDQYMFETHIRSRGLDPADILIELNPRPNEPTLRTEDILEQIYKTGDELALVLLGGINYYTGQVMDMPAITGAGHAVGAYVGFDLAHAAGNISLSLHNWDVDFAAWCSYKYLNAGPGAVGSVYIHQRFHNDSSIPRFAGWWGYDKATRFQMEPGFNPIRTAEGWQLSTPSLMLYAAHRSSLSMVEEAGWDNILQKQKKLTAWLWFLLDGINEQLPEGKTLTILTPREPERHGCQVSLYFPKDGRKVFDHLTQKGIMADWREPGVIRVAPVPLYNTFHEVWLLGCYLREMLEI